jgi:hypothetical protein
MKVQSDVPASGASTPTATSPASGGAARGTGDDTRAAAGNAASTATASASASAQRDAPSGPVQQLKAMIERLQKQLAALRLEIARASASAAHDGGVSPVVTSLQGEVTVIEAALQGATAALAELLLKSGTSTGLIDLHI